MVIDVDVSFVVRRELVSALGRITFEAAVCRE
jgi:hypothetical protein